MSGPQLKFYNKSCSWQDVKTISQLSRDEFNQTLCPGFEAQTNPSSFFRPGQIFAAQITSQLLLRNDRTFRNVDFGNLPLEPIPKLRAMAEREQLQDRIKRLTQIRQLPLDKMTRYCKEMLDGRKTVRCLLCPDRGDDFASTKEYWASYHFRFDHWGHYFAMIPKGLGLLSHMKHEKVIPWEKQSKELLQPLDSEFSAEKWILLEDVTQDIPIDTDEELAEALNMFSQICHCLAGPVMIQRFVVVREGGGHCLCLGIHT